MTPDQLTAVRAYIRATPALLAFAKTGNDRAIADVLNAPDPAIRITKPSITADHLRAMATAAAMVAFASGDTGKIARWQFAVTAASGFRDDIKLSDPVLAEQLAQATTDKVLSDELKAHYTTRDGSTAEREFGTTVSATDVSEALLIDRPAGKIASV